MFATFPVGLIVLVVVAVLLFLGVGHRVLDRMRLRDQEALVLLAVMFLGAFLPEVPVGRGLRLDVGGLLAPAGVAVYLLPRAGTTWEKARASVAALVTGSVTFATDKLLAVDPPMRGGPLPVLLDPVLLPGITAGLLAYALGRSRRASFVAGVLGAVLADLFAVVENLARRTPGALVSLGGAGVFDATVVAGFLAVFLAELIGETREALQGGPRSEGRHPRLLAALRGRVVLGGEGEGSPVRGQPPSRGSETGGEQGGAEEAGVAARHRREGFPEEGEGVAFGQDAGKPWGLTSLGLALAGAALALAAGVLGGQRLGHADEVLRGPLYVLRDQDGRQVMVTARRIHPGDEYIAENNDHYRVVRVRGRVAQALLLGKDVPPDLAVAAGAVPAGGRVLARPPRGVTVGIYHTHNDESYVPTSRTEAVNGRGGVHRVGDSLADALRGKGYRVVHDETVNLPHDNGAYRRSRRVVTRLLNQAGSDVLVDVHRDAGPWDSYARKVHGRWLAQVRLVVGRTNPGEPINLGFARQLKAIADRRHPGLVKGIFVGRDAYNQDLSPRSILIEVGTEQNAEPSARRGAALFADVLDEWVRGQVR